jgi:hypothetical protein
MPMTPAPISDATGQALVGRVLASSGAMNGGGEPASAASVALSAQDLADALAFAISGTRVPDEAWRSLLAACEPRAREIAQCPSTFMFSPSNRLGAPVRTQARLDAIKRALEDPSDAEALGRFAQTFGSERWVEWARARPLRKAGVSPDIDIKPHPFGVSAADFQAVSLWAAEESAKLAAWGSLVFASAPLESIKRRADGLSQERKLSTFAFLRPTARWLVGSALRFNLRPTSETLVRQLDLCADLALLEGWDFPAFFHAERAAVCAPETPPGRDRPDDGTGRANGFADQPARTLALPIDRAESLLADWWPLKNALSQGAGATRAHALLRPAPITARDWVAAIGNSSKSGEKARAALDSGLISRDSLRRILAHKKLNAQARGFFSSIVEADSLSAELSRALAPASPSDAPAPFSADAAVGAAPQTAQKKASRRI